MELIDLLFPRLCLECRREGAYICAKCAESIQKGKPVCPECDKPSIDGYTHTKCRKKLGLDGLTTLWSYKGIVRKAILSLKYKYAREVSVELSGLIVKRLKSEFFPFPDNLALIPIPAHWLKFNLRGFNQAEEVGKLISEDLGWDFVPQFLVRKELRHPQVKLRQSERKKNIKGAFSLNRDFNFKRLKPAFVVVFDDVYTTGSTLKEAAKVLKRNGVKVVWGLTLAR